MSESLIGITARAYSMQVTYDGGYILSGYSYGTSWPNVSDVYVIKVDSSLNPMWAKKYGGPYEDVGFCIRQTSDSGYIIVGYSLNGPPPFGDTDIYIIRIDINGNIIWTKNYDINVDKNYAYSVELANDGGFIVGGTTSTPFFIRASSLKLIVLVVLFGHKFLTKVVIILRL